MTSSTTDAGVLAARRRARADLAHGDQRAAARSHFRAMGIDPDRLEQPIVGIASMWTHTMPCNLNHRDLAAAVEQGVTAAGGVALAFNTIAVSDNQSQATPGMRASLVSRELIADSIELMDVAHDFDTLVCIVGCDKTVPAALMALARIDKPASWSTAARCARVAGMANGRRSRRCGRPSARAARASSSARSSTSWSAAPAPAPAPAPGTSPPTRWAWRSRSSG